MTEDASLSNVKTASSIFNPWCMNFSPAQQVTLHRRRDLSGHRHLWLSLLRNHFTKEFGHIIFLEGHHPIMEFGKGFFMVASLTKWQVNFAGQCNKIPNLVLVTLTQNPVMSPTFFWPPELINGGKHRDEDTRKA